MNRYGKGPGIQHRRRSYLVEAECRAQVGFYARSAEEAEDAFNDYREAVESRYPGIVLSITDVYEDE
ncbi:hypothetical protein [Eubacterium sp. 1001713B170207_170306_E7]|uniref:hypothetical protein n=1 Tax=Eubacterium sp. 1001713B170207_170306_E7 TaxID=2787097 RepID=UPI00189AF013|nr:hypothetical protein [Eubacterium sp. 1001713B170207_170306_E7]